MTEQTATQEQAEQTDEQTAPDPQAEPQDEPTPSASAGQATPDAAGAEQAAGADAGVEVRDAELPEVQDAGPAEGAGQLGVLLDAEMPVTASLGDVSLPVRDLLQLAPGSVLTLDRLAGEPVDLLLRGVRFATGRVVVVGDCLGVRVEEILDAPDDDDD